jgi:O-acetyl-ADP-ribose deacetylase (regulator of RNase III)
MIQYRQGNLLEAPSVALVNTVNELGVMGKGLALMFRKAFPENWRAYQVACQHGEVKVGRMFVVENMSSEPPRWIINFPTKRHWRHPSRLEWVQEGLKDLIRVLRDKQIRSVALPALGCGNGGLEWRSVREEIEVALSALPELDVLIYEPITIKPKNSKDTANRGGCSGS